MSSTYQNDRGSLAARMIGSISYGAENNNGAAHPEVTGTPTADLSMGMLHGYQPQWGAFASNTGYAKRNIIPILLEGPRGFEYMPSPAKLIACLKNLMETQAKTISGLRSGFKVNKTERAVGGGGHQMAEPSNVTEEISSINYVWDERYGKAIQKFWMHYIRNLIGDPITKQVGVMNLAYGGNEPTDHLADFYSFTMLFIEPDPLGRYVIDAWVINNMWPETSGTHEAGYNPTASWDIPEVSIPFTGIPVRNMGVNLLAQEILDGHNYINAGPLHQPAHVSVVSPAIADQMDLGYREQLGSMAASGIPLSEDGTFPENTRYVPPREAGAPAPTTDQMNLNSFG